MAPTVTRSGRIVKMPARYLPEEPANKAAGKAARQSARQPPQRTGIRLHGVTINTIHAVHRRMLRARQAQLCAGLARMALGEETLDIVAEGFQDMDLDTVAEGSQDMDLDEPKVHIKQEPNVSPPSLSNEESRTNPGPGEPNCACVGVYVDAPGRHNSAPPRGAPFFRGGPAGRCDGSWCRQEGG